MPACRVVVTDSKDKVYGIKLGCPDPRGLFFYLSVKNRMPLSAAFVKNFVVWKAVRPAWNHGRTVTTAR